MVEMIRSLRHKAGRNRRSGASGGSESDLTLDRTYSQSVSHCALNDMMCSQSPLVEVFKEKCGALYIVSGNMT